MLHVSLPVAFWRSLAAQCGWSAALLSPATFLLLPLHAWLGLSLAPLTCLPRSRVPLCGSLSPISPKPQWSRPCCPLAFLNPFLVLLRSRHRLQFHLEPLRRWCHAGLCLLEASLLPFRTNHRALSPLALAMVSVRFAARFDWPLSDYHSIRFVRVRPLTLPCHAVMCTACLCLQFTGHKVNTPTFWRTVYDGASVSPQ